MSSRSHATALHAYVHTRFREAFGEPQNTLQMDDHWSLMPSPGGIPINVLVNGTPKTPAVWVFDPYHKDAPVLNAAVANDAHADEIINQIRQRLQRAGDVANV